MSGAIKTVKKRILEPCFNPISTDGPSSKDIKIDKQLTKYMKKNIPVESQKELSRRAIALATLKDIFTNWVKDVGIEKKLSKLDAEASGGLIVVSGSYRLGVHEPGADIDTICIAPNHCNREDFFTSLRKVLISHPLVENLNAIETAAVPIMTFDFDSVNIDLLFAALPVLVVPSTIDIDDDSILIGVDLATEKSLNGPRVTNLIVKLVPKKAFDSFLITLRCVRKWAKKRGLYSNKMGYLGGVNFCILVAFVAQLYPNASPSSLLLRFFHVFSHWRWPNPVMLCKPFDAGLGLDIWDPKLGQTHRHCMPIITPAYPSMNSSVNVSRYSLSVMVNEFKRGMEIMGKISQSNGKIEMWDELFEPSDFFILYDHYIGIEIIAKNEEEHIGWCGFVESRLRKLVELLGQPGIEKVHLLPIKVEGRIIFDEDEDDDDDDDDDDNNNNNENNDKDNNDMNIDKNNNNNNNKEEEEDDNNNNNNNNDEKKNDDDNDINNNNNKLEKDEIDEILEKQNQDKINEEKEKLEKIKEERNNEYVISYFIGFEFNRKLVQGISLELKPLLGYFYNKNLTYFTPKLEGMDLRTNYFRWKKLPKFLFDSIGGYDKALEKRKIILKERRQKELEEELEEQKKREEEEKRELERLAVQESERKEDEEELKKRKALELLNEELDEMEPSKKRRKIDIKTKIMDTLKKKEKGQSLFLDIDILNDNNDHNNNINNNQDNIKIKLNDDIFN